MSTLISKTDIPEEIENVFPFFLFFFGFYLYHILFYQLFSFSSDFSIFLPQLVHVIFSPQSNTVRDLVLAVIEKSCFFFEYKNTKILMHTPPPTRTQTQTRKHTCKGKIAIQTRFQLCQ